jgi:hypothetical protein
MWIAVWVAPTNLHGSFGNCTKPEVNIRGTFSGIATSAVDLGYPFPPVR